MNAILDDWSFGIALASAESINDWATGSVYISIVSGRSL